jgi:hypothetical protein
MAYDEGLAERVRELLDEREDMAEKKMFGGLCFLLHGNMCCGIVGEELMLRVGAEHYAATLLLDHAREMDFTGRALQGFVYVGIDGLEEDRDLAAWVQRGVDFAATLPAK